MSYSNFTSLPPEQEQQFVVFERQSVESSQKAMMIGLISGAILGLFLIVLYVTSDAPAAMHADALDDDMAAEDEAPRKTKKKKKAAPAETAPAPTETTPAEGATPPAGAAATPTEAPTPPTPPTPPKGATKAPPSALVGQ